VTDLGWKPSSDFQPKPATGFLSQSVVLMRCLLQDLLVLQGTTKSRTDNYWTGFQILVIIISGLIGDGTTASNVYKAQFICGIVYGYLIISTVTVISLFAPGITKTPVSFVTLNNDDVKKSWTSAPARLKH